MDSHWEIEQRRCRRMLDLSRAWFRLQMEREDAPFAVRLTALGNLDQDLRSLVQATKILVEESATLASEYSKPFEW